MTKKPRTRKPKEKVLSETVAVRVTPSQYKTYDRDRKAVGNKIREVLDSL